MQNNFLKISIIVVCVLFFVNPFLVYAQQTPSVTTPQQSLPQYNQGVDLSIKDYLCTPEGNGTDLFNCVNRLTKFAISAGSIVLVFLIVLAGYIYIAGGEAQKSKAKGIVFSSLTGMVIILVSFTLLNFINPALVQIKPIQPPIFSSANLPKCEDIGFSSNCIISTGDAKGQVLINGTGKANGKFVLAGYDLSLYAPDDGKINVGYPKILSDNYNALKNIDFSSAEKIELYMKSKAPSTPLTGEMVMSTAKKYGNVDTKLMVAIMWVDSALGTKGKGARMHNPGNVGTWPGHDTSYGSWLEGVDVLAKWLAKHKI